MAAKILRSRRGAALTRGLLIASGLWLLFLTSGKAILDLDSNGSSDIWEEFYGQTLPADEDFDGDGLTNQQEYDRGTNPLVKDSSAETITMVPDPTSGTLSQFRFFGGIARTFTIEETTDLVSNPWSEAGTVPGADLTILMEENITSDKKFFRIDPQGAEPDLDGDELDSVEEHLLNTDKNKADTDGDYLSDAVEASGATSATLFDSDGDGINDGQALGYGQYWIDGMGIDAFTAFEAEVYVQRLDQTEDRWRAYADIDASGGQALEATSSTAIRADGYAEASGSARYRVYFTEAGNYYVWVRGRDVGGGGKDSVHMGLDDAVNQGVDQLGGFTGSYTWVSRSYDGHRAVYGVDTAGWHILNLWVREPSVVIDQIVLSGDEAFTPQQDTYPPGTSGADADNDGLPDDWEAAHGLSVGTDDGLSDDDGDGISASEERTRGLDPNSSDSDGDDMPDGYEIAKGLDPLNYYDGLEDPDGDDYPNVYEYKHGKDPLKEGFIDDADNPVSSPPAIWVVDKRGAGDFTTISSALAGIAGGAYEIVEINEAYSGLGLSDRYYLDSNGETFPLVVPSRTMLRGTTLARTSNDLIDTTIGSLDNSQSAEPYCILSDHCVLSQISLVNANEQVRSQPMMLVENLTHVRVDETTLNQNINDATDGGAFRILNSRAILEDCTIRGNTTRGADDHNGGAIAAINSILSIRSSFISRFKNSNMIPLTAMVPNQGGLIYSVGSTIRITGSTLSGGIARQGACFHATSASNIQLQNSRLMYSFGGTQVPGSAMATGGAFYVDGTSKVAAEHASLHSHKTFSGTGTTAYIEPGGQLTLTNCVDWENGGSTAYEGNVSISYSNIQGGYAGPGNINVTPDWNSSGNFPEDTLALNANSPCIDAGIRLETLPTDIDGDPRPNGALPDMGADESDQGSSTDTDGDGLADVVEHQLGTSSSLADSDGDLLPDEWEMENGFNPNIADTPLVTDTDGDGLGDWFEYRFGSNPRNIDTDTDEYSDLDEVLLALDPADAMDVQQATLIKTGHTYLGLLRDHSGHSDADQLSDAVEEDFWGSDPTTDQTDADTIPDDIEVRFSLDPVLDNTSQDSDADGYSDLYEYQNNLLPNHWDTDGDRLPDKYEMDLGFNPRTLLDGLAAWWRMDGEQEPVVKDHAAYLNPGRGHAHLSYEDYRFGQVAVFDGKDAYITVPHADVLNLHTDWSLSFWFWPESASTNAEEELFWKHEAYRFIYHPATGKLHLTFGNNVSSMSFTSNQALTPDLWNHVLISWEADTGALVLRINNAPVESFLFPASQVATSIWPMIIGSPRAEPSLTPTGKIDDVRLYTKLLSGTEQWELANPDDPTLEPNQDADGDGLLEYEEVNYGTDRLLTDSDGDGLQDGVEVHTHNTHPNLTDSDGDGLSDGDEVNVHHTDPALRDSDQDGLNDGAEVNIHLTDPNNKFSDGDSLEDGVEVEFGLDPLDENDATADADSDGISNADEIAAGTNPNFDESIDISTDTDGDGLSDYAETTLHHTDPQNPETHSGLSDGFRVRYGLINPDGSLTGHPEWAASQNVDGDIDTNAQEEAKGSSPTDPANASAVLIGTPIPVTLSPQAADENDVDPHVFREESATIAWKPEYLVFITGGETDFEPLSTENEIVIFDDNNTELGRVSVGRALHDPAKHVGDNVEDVYEFEDPVLISHLLTGLEPDENGELTLHFKFQTPKPPADDGENPPPGQSGGGNNGSGGSGAVSLSPPDRYQQGNDTEKLKTINGGSNQDPPANESKETYSASKIVLRLLPFELNHADGDDVDKPMDYLPRWVPNDGNGKGQPIYDTPEADFTMSNIGTNMQVTFLGVSHQLTQNQSDPLLYENLNDGITVALSMAPLNDQHVQEYLEATVTKSALGIVDAVFSCDETSASSGVFENDLPGVIMSIAELRADQIDTLSITLEEDNSSMAFTLTETAIDSKVFESSELTVELVNNPVLGGTLDIALTLASRNFDSLVVRTQLSGSEYRNFSPPTSTNLPKEDVPEFASFYVQVPVNLFPQGETPIVQFTVEVSGQDVQLAESNLIEMPDGKWRTEKKLILAAHDADESQMTSSDTNDYQVIKWDQNAEMDWTQKGGEVMVHYASAEFPAKAQAEGVALQSLDFVTKFGQGLNPESRIRKPFLEMGYTMYKDYHASTSDTLNDYVKGKQIWYSMSHGATPDGTPNTEFYGLAFKDAETAADAISSSDLNPLNLNYRLAVVDGCVSAQTTTSGEQIAYSQNNLLSGPREFAESFGDDVAYIGWGWSLGPNAAQTWSSEFVNNLKGGKTVGEAHSTFLEDNSSAAASRLMKLHGRSDTIIDMKAKPNATFASDT